MTLYILKLKTLNNAVTSPDCLLLPFILHLYLEKMFVFRATVLSCVMDEVVCMSLINESCFCDIYAMVFFI